jgi:hypothetical protein
VVFLEEEFALIIVADCRDVRSERCFGIGDADFGLGLIVKRRPGRKAIVFNPPLSCSASWSAVLMPSPTAALPPKRTCGDLDELVCRAGCAGASAPPQAA